MDITFRGTGPWGPGKGANLQAAEVDENFWEIATAVLNLENNPALPVGISSITISGTQMTITLSNGDVMGPYTIPVLVMRWRDEWQPNTPYVQLDVFKVTDRGIYLVQLDHVSGDAFDPNIAVDGAPALMQIFGSVDASLSQLPDVSLQNLTNGDVLIWNAGDELWENTYLGQMAYQDPDFVQITGGTITGMAIPFQPTDVATKEYVDGAVTGGSSIPTATMMSNISVIGAPAAPNTLSDFLDAALAGPARGTLLYRGGTGWLSLAPGTSGQFLRTNGSGADPAWAVGSAGVTSITAGTGIDTQPDTIVATGVIALAPAGDKTLMANTSGAAAPPVAMSLTALFDAVVSNARGTVFTRTIAGWAGLAPGVNGYFLRTNGSGADVSWDAPAGAGTVTSVATGAGLTGGPITGAGTISLASVGNNNLLANISGVSAAPGAATVSQLLDSALSAAQGAVIYRGATAWVALAPGTNGQTLTTGGAAANPSWANAAAAAPIASGLIIGNVSGATAAPIGVALTNVIDAVFGSTRGMVIYRGATGWAALAAGTAGQVLTTGGSAGDPSWVAAASGGSGITELTGDVAAGPGSGSQAATLATTAVAPGSYTLANITVDAKGRVTAAASGSAPTSGINQLTGDATAGPGTGSQALTLSTSGVTAGTYTIANITVDAKGRVTGAANGTAITQLSGDATTGAGGGVQTLTLSTSGVSAGSYTAANITVDAKGRVTAAANGGAGGGGTVTSVAAGTGLSASPSPIVGAGTMSLTVPVTVANGGTGATTLPTNNVLLGNGASPLASATPGANGTILASNGVAPSTFRTLNALLDIMVGTAAQGQILYRGAAVWGALAPGTAGQFLQTGGTGANPAWASAAPLASPVFTGDPQAPTPATADNDTSIATTAFVKAQGYVTGGPYLPTAGGTVGGNLAVTGTVSSDGGLFVGSGAGAAATLIELGLNRIADGNAHIDFHGAAGAADYDFRILRSPGTNGAIDFLNLGTGLLNITTSGTLRAVFGNNASNPNIDLSIGRGLAAQGIQCRPGQAGPPIGSQFNINWTGAAILWIDGSNVGTITLTSDYRIKENVADLPPMWDRVKALRPVSYTIKDNVELLSQADPMEQWGFIAHELQETLTEAAATGYKDAPNLVQSPNVMVLLAPLTRALQEAMARIEALEARLPPATE